MGFDWEFILDDEGGDLADRYDAHIVDDYDDPYKERGYHQNKKEEKSENYKANCETMKDNKTTNDKGDHKMRKAIRNSELKNHIGSMILVKGKVTYSRIGRPIQGEELKNQNLSNLQRGMPQYFHAYTTMTITEAVVQVEDPENPTLPEQWAMSKLYKSRSARANKNAMSFRAICLSSILPGVFKTVIRDGKTLLIGENADGREIAGGTEVTLVLQVYESRGKLDVALQNVVVAANEIPWYTNTLQRLAKMLHVDGIIPAAGENASEYVEEANNAGKDSFELIEGDGELPF